MFDIFYSFVQSRLVYSACLQPVETVFTPSAGSMTSSLCKPILKCEAQGIRRVLSVLVEEGRTPPSLCPSLSETLGLCLESRWQKFVSGRLYFIWNSEMTLTAAMIDKKRKQLLNHPAQDKFPAMRNFDLSLRQVSLMHAGNQARSF